MKIAKIKEVMECDQTDCEDYNPTQLSKRCRSCEQSTVKKKVVFEVRK